MSSLSDRLERLRRGGDSPVSLISRKSPPSGAPGAVGGGVPPGGGWEQISDFFWERSVDYPPLLPSFFDKPFILLSPSRSEDLIFYDLETTGLSGGAGNTAFLIGLGRQTPDRFTVTQLFLADYPGEPAMLGRYADFTGSGMPQVSYNGRSFDSQVLRTRFLLNRMKPVNLPQVDLLYPARRLWKTVLPDLSLSTLEKDVLGVAREDDLPGREAPDAWFEWLGGDPGRIDGVFRHNADDITSMARLLTLMESLGGEDRAGLLMNHPPTFRGMARQWEDRDPSGSRRCLERGWKAGESSCGRELARNLRREGDWGSAVKIWTDLCSSGRDFHSAVELAKYREHRLKDPIGALEILSGFEDLHLGRRRQDQLTHRKERLYRKLKGIRPD